MKRVMLFDLSEVLIAGLLGVEQTLALPLQVQPASVLSALSSDLLDQLWRAEFTEAQYLQDAITNAGWKISIGAINSAIRENPISA